MKKINIMIVDDQKLFREGLTTIINLTEDMVVLCEACDGQEAFEKMTRQIDVILMDIRMPVMNGVKACEIIKNDYPDVVIVILTTFDDDDYVVDALAKGAEGYILKDIGAQNLLRCIRDAYNGEMIMPAKIASKLAKRIRPGNTASDLAGEIAEFSQREKDICILISRGLSNSQIARKLFLSEGTVKNYISGIYSKLGTSSRANAIMILSGMGYQ